MNERNHNIIQRRKGGKRETERGRQGQDASGCCVYEAMEITRVTALSKSRCVRLKNESVRKSLFVSWTSLIIIYHGSDRVLGEPQGPWMRECVCASSHLCLALRFLHHSLSQAWASVRRGKGAATKWARINWQWLAASSDASRGKVDLKDEYRPRRDPTAEDPEDDQPLINLIPAPSLSQSPLHSPPSPFP